MKYKIFTLYILVGVMIVGGTNITLARVYNKERVPKTEAAKWYGPNWEQNDFRGGILHNQIATDSYIEKIVNDNDRANEIKKEAEEKKKEEERSASAE